MFSNKKKGKGALGSEDLPSGGGCVQFRSGRQWAIVLFLSIASFLPSLPAGANVCAVTLERYTESGAYPLRDPVQANVPDVIDWTPWLSPPSLTDTDLLVPGNSALHAATLSTGSVAAVRMRGQYVENSMSTDGRVAGRAVARVLIGPGCAQCGCDTDKQ